MDELGSGVLNVNSFIQEYAEDGKPTFAEGHTFKMIIPIPAIEEDAKDFDGVIDGVYDGVNDGVNDGAIEEAIEGAIEGVTKGVKEKLTILLSAIVANEGNRAPGYIKTIEVSERTMERYLQQLKEAGLIEFRGDVSKTGGYYLTNKMKEKLN